MKFSYAGLKDIWTETHTKKILFIHIPKTAGTSVNHVLSSNGYNEWIREDRFNYHDPYFVLQKNNLTLNWDNCFIFSIVRNPFTRTFSSFKFFNKINELSISFSQYLHLCSLGKNSGVKAKEEFWRTSMIFYPQSLFLYSMKGKLKKDNIYRFENLNPLKRKISTYLNKKIDFPFLNMGNKNDYYKDYTPPNIEKVKEIYSIDFENFNYSTQFK